MNIQAYIESGILEEYVLGTVSPQEKQEVECMSHIYPEIKEELLRTESALEEYAIRHQTAPPPSLKESLFAKMDFDASRETSELNTEEPQITPPAEENGLADQRTETHFAATTDGPRIVNDVFDRVEVREVTPLWSKIAVAAAILLAIFAGWSATQLTKLKEGNEEMAAALGTMKSEYETSKKELEYASVLANMYRSQNYRVVHMAGLDKSPKSSVSAFWNQKTNEVMLDVQSLPPAPAGKQYQLWTIVDGKPVDVGMLDNEFTGKVLKMKETKPGAVAFAITLEKEGGVPSPTMEEMYVMGKVS